MAKLVAATPFGPEHFDRLLTIAVPGTASSFSAFTADDDVYTFAGNDFAYDVDGALAGTITRVVQADALAHEVLRVTGLNLPVADFSDFADGFINLSDVVDVLFAGADSFVGSGANDTLGALAGGDTIDAGGGDDLLLGGDGADSLLGGDGNDIFDGGDGIDRMAGGAGDDVFLVRQAGDVVTEASGAGYDSVFSYVTRTLGANQENLTLLGDDALDGSGNGSVNFIVGNSASNGLTGAGGSDTLLGGAGADSLDGGGGNDLLWGQAPVALGGVTLTATAKGYLGADNALVSGLGGTAGFGEHALALGDDPSSAAIDITSVFGPTGLNFFGIAHATMYVNNNGNVTFDSPLPQFAPDAISAGSLPIIAPFWADVDTRPSSGSAADHVYWDLDTMNGVVTVTWNAVGHYDRDASPSNSFQLQLVNRGGGDFDIIFRYASIDWTTGDDIVGAGTLPGEVARAGYSAGNGVSYFELAQSGHDAQVLALDSTAGNTGRTGTYVFKVRNGDVLAVDDGAGDTLAGGPGKDTLAGAGGNDRFVLEHSGSGNADLIQDFTTGKDRIVLDSGFFDVLAPGTLAAGAFYKGTTAHDGDDRIIYHAAGGKLYYDEDGLGGSSAVLIATLAQSPALAASDFEVI